MRIKTKTSFQTQFWLCQLASIIASSATAFAAANVAPTVVVTNAVQRPGTTFMDIDYRVNDPDDATVQTAALGFVNGGTNLSDIIKISTLVEGTATNLGTNVPANTPLRLTWNVAADWNTNFGNVQVEVLAKDGRGLLPFHWITLPSNGPNPEVTINDGLINDNTMLPLWYWLIATNDPAIRLVGGKVYAVGGNYDSNLLAQYGTTTQEGRQFLYEKLAVRVLTGIELSRASSRYGFDPANQPFVARGLIRSGPIYGWGKNDIGQLNFPANQSNTAQLATGGDLSLRLSGGAVDGWGLDAYGQLSNIPTGLTNLTAIAAGWLHIVALKTDGTVIAWGHTNNNRTAVPLGLSNVVAVAAGGHHSLALRSDGTVVGWGYNAYGQSDAPPGLSNVVAISAGLLHSLALRSNGTVVAWGVTNVPVGLSNVTAVSSGNYHNLALKSDHTVVAWSVDDSSQAGQINVPGSLSNVTAIAGGNQHSVALTSDGRVVVWGDNTYGQTRVPAHLPPIGSLAQGCCANHILVLEKPNP